MFILIFLTFYFRGAQAPIFSTRKAVNKASGGSMGTFDLPDDSTLLVFGQIPYMVGDLLQQAWFSIFMHGGVWEASPGLVKTQKFVASVC